MMSDVGKQESANRKAPRSGPRKNHVAVHVGPEGGPYAFDEVVVFGQEIDALRFLVGKPGWEYKAVANGEPFTEAGS